MKNAFKNIFAVLSVALCASANAKVETPRVFSDGMVLQREAAVKIWGTADAGASVAVEFAGQKKTATAASDGSWSLKLDPMTASKQPREMVISENGKPSKKIGDILVGEVWILGGQSNMGVDVKDSGDAKAAVARSDYPILRYFGKRGNTLSREPQKDSPKDFKWVHSSPETSGNFSAVGFYFGEDIMKKLDVPVGLVFTAVGGTPMIAWVSEESAMQNKYMKPVWLKFKAEADKWDDAAYKNAVAAFKAKIKKAAEEDKIAAEKKQKPATREWNFRIPPNPVSPWHDYATPVYHYNVKIAPISGLAARGVLWYQGESDAEANEDAFLGKFVHIVNEWRKYFENPDMPFIEAQLTSRAAGVSWPHARNAQLKAAMTLKNVYIVNILDGGERDEIHPKNKTIVGERMAGIALAEIYGDKSVHPFSPVFKSAKYSGSAAQVEFYTFARGLVAKGEMRGFEVLSGGKWNKASASLSGNKVLVKSADNSEISGVRYLWAPYPLDDMCLYSRDGLPAFPFTDEKK